MRLILTGLIAVTLGAAAPSPAADYCAAWRRLTRTSADFWTTSTPKGSPATRW